MLGLVLSFVLIAFTCPSSATLNCSAYKSDKDLLRSLPFISINPEYSSSDYVTHAYVNGSGYVTDLYLNGENKFPLSIFCFKHLTKLLFNRTNFESNTIPPEIGLLAPTLQSLSILNTPLPQPLPSELFYLTSLSTLIIVNCSLESLPSAFRQLKALTTVNVGYNPLINSLDVFNGFDLSNLEASNCRVDHLPRNLPRLLTFNLNNNKLTSLVNIETLGAKTSSWKSLSFDNNEIESIPTEIGQFKFLAELNLANNKLTTLPEETFDAYLLKMLDLQNNKFNEFEIQWIICRCRRLGITLKIVK